MKYADWQTLTFPRALACCVPPNTTHELIDDETAICLTLPTIPHTEMLAGVFPLRQSSSALLESLELELRDFTQRCVSPRVLVNGESYEPATDVEFENIACCQSVLALPNENYWIARAYGRIGGDEILLVHWNGPKAVAFSTVLSIFVSLVPLCLIQTSG